MMIWITFSSNILIFLTALVLLRIHTNRIISKQFIWFITLTGISSGVAAFGHLPILDERLANYLLLASRFFSLGSVYLFTVGSLAFSSFRNNKMIRITNVILFVTMVIVLFWNNQFLPVMIYGVIGFLGIGLSAYFSRIDDSVQGRYRVIRGVVILSLSALFFALFKENYHFLAINFSHIMVSYSLVLFSRGFVELN
ncbi:MAG: hypothetical protein P8I31_06380 [Bacteroidia bacterium]|nr:hypothetical protein [Bacteroidia bacterium]|tara:strand:+ start:7683 stop:8273 length:591 start_codon:yes stop_codon:yes gene_type:complete